MQLIFFEAWNQKLMIYSFQKINEIIHFFKDIEQKIQVLDGLIEKITNDKNLKFVLLDVMIKK